MPSTESNLLDTNSMRYESNDKNLILAILLQVCDFESFEKRCMRWRWRWYEDAWTTWACCSNGTPHNACYKMSSGVQNSAQFNAELPKGIRCLLRGSDSQ